MLVAIYKLPLFKGGQPEKVERIYTYDDMRNFLDIVRGIYRPVSLQVILVREGEDDDQTPPRDDQQYFKEDEFGPEEPPYNPVMFN